jgi:hypothetical protein
MQQSPDPFANCSPAVGTIAAFAIQENLSTSSRQLGNDEGYRNSCPSVYRLPATPVASNTKTHDHPGHRSSGGGGQVREKWHWPGS